MAVLDSFIKSMKLNDDQSDEYFDNEDYYDEGDDYIEDKPKKKFFGKSNEDEFDDEEIEERPSKPRFSAKVTPMKQQTVKRGAQGMEVCVIKPTTVEEAREITETLLSDRTVVLNLEGIDVDLAQRIIDFTSGSCYAIQGSLQKISHYIFIITPASVDISGDFQDIIAGSLNVPSLNPEL